MQCDIEQVTEGINASSPCFDNENALWVCIPESGEIMKLAADGVITRLEGVVSGIHFDPASQELWICDAARNSLLKMTQETIDEEFSSHEGKEFLGPNSIHIDKKGNIFFTDAGPFGTTSLDYSRGSVFAVMRSSNSILKPLADRCLAHPSDLVYSTKNSVLYITEMVKNRILRIMESPSDVFHVSIFYQFNGYLGPSAISCDQAGRIYVGRSDPIIGKAILTVLSEEGEVLGEKELPGNYITGLAWDNGFEALYATEKSTASVYKLNFSF
eukprot:gb/GECH01011505.1/.p1 GENE.gb/GECH01011505.1/~~gb/GECH01011505.1/.p1  ORF type:complete len:271 (+),score=51.65 gb/GECH01011505.1/:1-813(+)